MAEGANDLSFDPPGTLCSSCHVVSNWTEIDGTEHNVATNGAGSCATCHNSSRQEVIDAITLGANPTNCLDCHSNKNLTVHGNVDHVSLGYVILGATSCASCHDPGGAANATIDITHSGNCTLCHTTIPNLQPGIPAGGGDCATCHTGTWDALHPTDPGHTGIVVASTSCANCHDDTLVSAAPETHNACTSCHDSGTGALIGSAVGNPTPTDCTTCHTGTWSTIHPTTGYSHTGIVVASTSCADCHDDTLVSAAPETHNACTSCHDSGSGSLIGSAVGNPTPTDCTTCHTGTWETTHTNDPGHTGIVVASTTCADCHDDTFVSAAPETHNACTSCHDAGTGALIGSAIGNPSPTDCTTCHTGTWETTHANDPGHTGIVVASTTCADCHDDTLVSAAPETHDACISCHDSGTGALIGSAIGNPTPTDCTTCHTGTWETTHTTDPGHTGITVVGTTGCADCHDDTLVSTASDTHNACISCHDSGTGALIGSAIGNPSPTDCITCHTGTWETTHTTDPGHTGIVVATTSCADCHDDTLVSAAPETHDACTSCHDAGTGALIGSAIGNPTPTDCTACHTDPFDTIHAAYVHTVAEGANDLSFDPPGTLCSSCHVVSNWTEIEGTEHNVATNGAGSCATCHNSSRQEVIDAITLGANPTNCLDCHSNKNLTVHGNVDHVSLGYVILGATSCASCHDPGGAANATIDITHSGNCTLCHTTIPNLQPGIPAGGGDCATCHTGTWDALHPTDPGHTGIVVASTSCANCHDDTLVSAAPETHNACTSCHDSGTGALIGSAVGNPTPTDCTTCHTGTWETTHTTDPGHTGITVGATGCADCHDDTLVSAASDTHNACTSCHDSGSGALIGSAIGNPTPTDCTTCHTGTWEHNSSDTGSSHTGITVGATGCADCHDDTLVSAAPETHNACTSCHDSGSGALIGSAIGNPTPDRLYDLSYGYVGWQCIQRIPAIPALRLVQPAVLAAMMIRW